MNGKVGGSPCCGIRDFFFSRIVFVINTKGVAYLFIVFLTFINRGGVKLSSTIIIIAKKTYETLFLDTVVPVGCGVCRGAGVLAERQGA